MKKKILLLLSTVFLLCLFCLPVGAATFTAGGVPVAGITAGETATTYDYSYAYTDVLGSGSGFVIPIQLNQGGLLTINLSQYANGSDESVYVRLYQDAACTMEYPFYMYGSIGGTDQEQIKLPKGTYYLKLYSYVYSFSNYTNVGQISASLISYEDRSLAPGKASKFSKKDTGTYFKIKPNKTGYITIGLSGDYYGDVTLCNSKKKAVSKDAYISSTYIKKVVFAVKKNTTYYIKVKLNGDNPTSIKYSLNGVSEKSGTKISKAVGIKKGKTANGVILPGDKNKDFYKITLTKPQVVRLRIKGNVSSGMVTVTVIDKNKKREIGSYNIRDVGYQNTLTSTTGWFSSKAAKWSKGTYYIKVSGGDSKPNGHYSITWLK